MGYLSTAEWKNLLAIVSDSLSDSVRFSEIYHVDRAKAEKAIRSFTSVKDMAALGNKTARQNLVDYYIRILESYDKNALDEMINEAVNFIDIELNLPEVIFELLLADFSFEEIFKSLCRNCR